MRPRSMFPAGGVLVALLNGGCPSDDGGDDGATTAGSDGADGSGTSLPQIDYATDVQPIWNANCTCHLQGPSGSMTATVLTLNEDVSYAQLVDTPAEQLESMDRVTPGQPEQSYLWHKLEGTQLDVGGMGTLMPQVGSLDEQDLMTIQAWIAGGAEP